MDVSTDFMQCIHMAAHKSQVYQEHYAGQQIIIDFDNALAHSQTEQHVQ